MQQPRYKRILLKLSGEALSGPDKKQVIDFDILQQFAQEVKTLVDAGVQVAIVIGGGNIFRGALSPKLVLLEIALGLASI